jgi:hypothetical protein
MSLTKSRFAGSAFRLADIHLSVWPTRPSDEKRSYPSADALCQLDNDPFWAAYVAEPVAVLVALQLAHELSALGLQTCNDGVNVFDSECDMADSRCVRRCVLVAALRQRSVEFR